MGFTYTIICVAMIDRFTGLPFPYTGAPVAAEHRPYFTNHEKWNNKLKQILFGEDIPEMDTIPVKDIIRSIHPYDDLVEKLVEENLHLFWTREKHRQFCAAFKTFAEDGFYISFW